MHLNKVIRRIPLFPSIHLFKGMPLWDCSALTVTYLGINAKVWDRAQNCSISAVEKSIVKTPCPVLQVLPPPVHQLLTHESEEHGGPAGQLRGHPDELPGLCRHQAAAHQGHTEETVQGDHDGTGKSLPMTAGFTSCLYSLWIVSNLNDLALLACCNRTAAS